MYTVANALLDLLTIAPEGIERRVAFVARNQPDGLAAFLGLLAAGCSIRMVYPFQSAEAMASELGRLDVDTVVAAERDFSSEVMEVINARELGAIALGDMNARQLSAPRRWGGGGPKRNPRVTLLTSGTTGPPKEFALPYELILEHFSSIGLTPGAELGTGSKIPSLVYFPVSNISGLYSTLSPLLNGIPIVLLDKFDLGEWRRFVARYRPQDFGIPPLGIKMLLDAGVDREELSFMRSLGVGAAPIDINIHRQFEECYDIALLPAYGATEFAGAVAAMTWGLWKEWGKTKLGSVGRALCGMQIRIVDPESGEELTPGNVGIVEVKCPRVGNINLLTSDLGLLDEDGFLFLKGRADGAIIRGGFKLLPSKIEAALLLNPAIASAAVVGIDDNRLGQVPGAVVVLKPDAQDFTRYELESELRRHLPATHIPGRWCLVEELPKTVSLKVDIPALKALLSEPLDSSLA